MLETSKEYSQLPVHLNDVLQRDVNDGEAETIGKGGFSRAKRVSRERLLWIALLLQSLVFLWFVLSSWKRATPLPEPSRLYSPAEPFLREEIKVFSVGVHEKTIYQGVGEDVDQAWEDLYEKTTFRLPKSEAVQLPNKTWPIESDPGYYIAQLDVFHQLHCLNKLRKLLQDPGNPAHHTEHDHTSHCVDSLRQYIMCNIDISVVIWQWDKRAGKVLPSLSYPHKCYNYDAIREYAEANEIDGYINADVFVDTGLPDPPIIYGP